MNAAEQARFFSTYAKGYSAGAFATPTRTEIEADPGLIREYPGECMFARKKITRASVRQDFTGDTFTIEAGARIVTHIAKLKGAPVPLLRGYDYVFAYTEDDELNFGIREQGFNLRAVRVSSASELINVWWQKEECEYPPYDQATVVEVDTPPMDEEVLYELSLLDGFADDVPLYSDGSWSALTLRGYYPDDPGKNAKPAEQDRKWKAAHPDELELPCVWTKLALDCPATVSWVQAVPWWGQLERVRFLRMTRGKLGRHTDILDRDGGTRDGEIVRFHVPLCTHPDITMTCWELDGTPITVHLAEGNGYYLDARKPHSVVNPTDVVRVHLVVDVVCNSEVRKYISA